MTELMDAKALEGLDVDGGVFATELQVWNGVGYDAYGWAGDVGDDGLNYQWLNEGTWDAVNVDATVGKGFWVKSVSSGSVTLSGEVPAEDSITLNIGVGYTLIANPYPVSVSIQDIQPVGLNGLDVDTGTFAAEIQLWNGVGYDAYGWSGDVGDASLNNKWLDEGTWDPAVGTLEIGHGCWIKSDTAGTVTFSK